MGLERLRNRGDVGMISKPKLDGRVAESADASDLKSEAPVRGCEGSSPSSPTGLHSALPKRDTPVVSLRMHSGPTPARLCAVLAGLLASRLASGADVLILRNGLRLEGSVSESDGTVTVCTPSGRRQFAPEEVKGIIRRSTPLHERFVLDPRPEDLVLLAYRAGARLELEKASCLVEAVRNAESPTEAAVKLLDTMRISPRHVEELVLTNIEEFKREFGPKATVYEGKHYIVLTTLGDFWARKIAVRMDGIFEEYQRRLVFDEKLEGRFIIRIYGSADEYLAHGGLQDSSACFFPHRRELSAPFDSNEDRLFRSLFHEGMHQFLHFYVPDPPAWFDEGLAQYFETARILSGTGPDSTPIYAVGLKDESLAKELRTAAKVGKTIPIARLIAMSRDEFYGDDRRMNYICAWAFTHFLLESGDESLRRLWAGYFLALRSGVGQKEANNKVFSRVDMAALEKRFLAYIRKF